MPNYAILHEKPECFYEEYERKGETQRQTHYCPGCGHGIIHKLLAECIDELGIRDRTIIISPVGCSVFIYYYFDVGNIQVAHGRASAVAAAVKRARPDAIVISYQGDGDLAAIGSAEILHTANRGENVTVMFVNNAIYGMTGGQMAPTTLPGQVATTCPLGREVEKAGWPIRMAELLASLRTPGYIARVAVHTPLQVVKAKQALRKAFTYQVEGRCFSLIEFLSTCPTNWGMTPIEATKWLEANMMPYYPLGERKVPE